MNILLMVFCISITSICFAGETLQNITNVTTKANNIANKSGDDRRQQAVNSLCSNLHTACQQGDRQACSGATENGCKCVNNDCTRGN